MPLLKTSVACLVAAALLSGIRFDPSSHATQASVLAQIPTPVSVGERLAPAEIHVVAHPGRYGLGPQLRGSHYGIVGGQLIRFDPHTYKVQSILRQQVQLLD